jgi:hypothetical protein
MSEELQNIKVYGRIRPSTALKSTGISSQNTRGKSVDAKKGTLSKVSIIAKVLVSRLIDH